MEASPNSAQGAHRPDTKSRLLTSRTTHGTEHLRFSFPQQMGESLHICLSLRNDAGPNSGGSHRCALRTLIGPVGKALWSLLGRLLVTSLDLRAALSSRRALGLLCPGPPGCWTPTKALEHSDKADVESAQVSRGDQQCPKLNWYHSQGPHLPEAAGFLLHGHSLSARSPEPSHIPTNERGARP